MLAAPDPNTTGPVKTEHALSGLTGIAIAITTTRVVELTTLVVYEGAPRELHSDLRLTAAMRGMDALLEGVVHSDRTGVRNVRTSSRTGLYGNR